MRIVLIIASVLFAVGTVPASEMDSTDLIFNDAEVHRYDLTYYVDGWSDSMAFNKEFKDEAYMPARFCYHTPDGDSIVLDSIGVRYKGNSSYSLMKTTNPKKSFKLHFDKYKDQTFFECEKLNLNNCIEDPSYMREKIGYDIIRNYLATPRVSYAVLYVHDTMIGVYAQVEQVNKDFLKRNFGDKYDGGSLFKAGDNGAVLDYRGPNQIEYEKIYEIKENENDDDAWSHLITTLYKLNDTLSGVDKIVEYTKPHLDFTSACQHLAWTIVLSHFDSYTGTGRNYYLYDNPESKKIVFIPWDINMAFGQLPYQWNVITNSAFDIANLNVRPLNKRIVSDPELKSEYIYWLRHMISGSASAENVAKEADRIKAIIDPFVKMEPDSSRFYSYADFVKNIDEDLVIPDGFNEIRIPGIKSFSVARNAELLKQIAAGVSYKPVLRNTNRSATLNIAADAAASVIKVTYQFQNTGKTLKLFDGRGQLIKRVLLDKTVGSVVLDAASLPSGVYVVSVDDRKTVLSDQVVFTR